MLSRKKIFALLVIGAALFASYFIISFSSKEASAENTSGETRTLTSEIKRGTELLTKSVLSILHPDSDSADNENAAEGTVPDNLTDYLAKVIAGQIQDKNKSGPTRNEDGTSAILVPGEENLANMFDALSENEAIPSQPAYHPKVAAAKFLISKDTSKLSQEKYVQKYVAVLNQIANNLPKPEEAILQDISEKKDPASALQFASLLGTGAESYAQMQVPENWVSFHKGVLSHFYSAKDIWMGIANFQADPVQALVSLKEIPLLSQSAAGLQIKFNEQLMANGLSL